MLRKGLATLRAERQRATAELRKAASSAEDEVARLEEEKDQLEATLADPATYEDPDKLVEANRRYKAVTTSLEDAEEVWMLAQEELDEADSVFDARERELRGENG